MPKKILVVDDEPNVLRIIVARLSADSYNVVTASDAISAVERAQEEKPDLILLDIQMPAGDGTMVFENLKMIESTKSIPVIFMTANPSADIRQLVVEMGARDFVIKPFDANELMAKIKRALGEDPGKYNDVARDKWFRS